MIKYPRTSSGNSSGFYDDDEPMHPFQTPPQSPASSPVPSSALASQCLQRHIVRMFSSEDASGTSAVAIDNKIEQAMDLVKSHLMIAVREEVEVLKVKIAELMEKINQLETERSIYRSHMPQDILERLDMQIQVTGSTPATGSSMQVAGAATPAAITAAPAASTQAGNTSATTATATPQSSVGSGTATPTTQQPTQTTAATQQEKDDETSNTEEKQQGTDQSTNPAPMS